MEKCVIFLKFFLVAMLPTLVVGRVLNLLRFLILKGSCIGGDDSWMSFEGDDLAFLFLRDDYAFFENIDL